MNNLCSPPATLCRYCATRKLARACAIRCLSKLSVAKSLTNRFLREQKHSTKSSLDSFRHDFDSHRHRRRGPSFASHADRISHIWQYLYGTHDWLWLRLPENVRKQKQNFKWIERNSSNNNEIRQHFSMNSWWILRTINRCIPSPKCCRVCENAWMNGNVSHPRAHMRTRSHSALLVGSQWNNTTTRARRQEKKSSACVPRNYGWCSSSLSFAVTATDDDAPSRRIAACFQPTNFAVTWFIAKNRRTKQENETCRLSLFSVSFVIALVAFFRDFFPFAVSVILCSFTVAACLVVRRYFWFTFHVQHSPFHRARRKIARFSPVFCWRRKKMNATDGIAYDATSFFFSNNSKSGKKNDCSQVSRNYETHKFIAFNVNGDNTGAKSHRRSAWNSTISGQENYVKF